MIPPIASRFIAGESPAAALEHAREMNADGVKVILNLLGEHYDDPGPVADDREAYLDLIETLGASQIEACISVKPSQLGLDLSAETFAANYREIVEYAHEQDVFVWCDMEDASTTDDTLDVFEELARESPWTVGLCLQSNLRRTADDLERVVDLPARIRLVKGAYDEPESIAYTDSKAVNERFREDLSYLFEHRDRGVAIGSHDPTMIALGQRLADEYGTSYEVQMLMGVREDEQRDLAARGVDVWQYAPFGNRWPSYFYRRVRERKENLLFAMRAILGR